MEVACLNVTVSGSVAAAVAVAVAILKMKWPGEIDAIDGSGGKVWVHQQSCTCTKRKGKGKGKGTCPPDSRRLLHALKQYGVRIYL